ncbi:hypothetical protein J3D55_002580 [Chryseobacterium ginsenosidimutans]|jgi:hypothetical protein|uniref:bacteriocin-like protein n=1 Tax=Chryseobacterium ginsenosidimutans TaxID=687846 RepID=UPI00216984B7|nr:hypothetical protein [Chryseobacterium ginsenosidimutans]MCS3869664.1 hypothetical protein [Chryseobacterium ginsenosidimutans]
MKNFKKLNRENLKNISGGGNRTVYETAYITCNNGKQAEYHYSYEVSDMEVGSGHSMGDMITETCGNVGGNGHASSSWDLNP